MLIDCGKLYAFLFGRINVIVLLLQHCVPNSLHSSSIGLHT